jgi:glyoxylase-like metal-dependent hydrolase (beta-lactamase superfamily II)
MDPIPLRLGALELWVVSDGEFRLDGGAMFGVVPRVMWEKVKPPDERNRIRVTTNCLLIRRGDRLGLVDTGLGPKHDAKFQDQFGFEQGARRLPDSIRAAGFEPGDVTDVLCTHLHFDHAGWNTCERGGRLVPTFARARYWIARGEAEHAAHPNERDRASYDPRDVQPLFDARAVELFDDDAEPIPGVRLVKAPGHNRDMCVVTLDGGDAASRAVFWADLVPTTAHVGYPWIMAYDLYPLETLENKKRWLPRAADEGWLCVFEHDPIVPLARVREVKAGRYEAVEAVAVGSGGDGSE